MSLLSTTAVTQRYPLPRTRLLSRREHLTAVDNINLTVDPGEAVGIVGESGSGKSTLTRLLSGDERPLAGTVAYNDVDVWACTPAQRREFRRNVQIVLQNPRASFDPRLRVGASLAEPLRALRIDVDYSARVAEVLDQVGMGTDALRKYPHQFSGGQLQRLAIARALMPKPAVLIADEPVSALDVSIRAQVLNVLKDLVEHLGLALILIAHDLSVVAYTTNRVAVMAAGRIIEEGPPLDLFENPRAEQTKELVGAVLTVEQGLAGAALSNNSVGSDTSVGSNDNVGSKGNVLSKDDAYSNGSVPSNGGVQSQGDAGSKGRVTSP